MPRPNDAALQERKRGLDAVRRNVAVNINAVVMVDCEVAGVRHPSLNDCGRIRREFIRHNDVNVFRDVFLNVLRQRARLHILSLEEPQIAVALLDADNDGFVVVLRLPMTAPCLSANQRLIHLYDAVQRLRIEFLHSCTNAMAEIPRRFVGDTQNALQLIGAHSLLRFAEQVDAQEPLPQWQVGVIENRSSSDRELIAALVAIKLMALDDLRNVVRLATWAHNRVGPAKRFEILAALVFAAELFNQSAKINGVFHV